ncbi:MAG: fatty acid desaturase family protein, partial [Pirellulaceae bacterium]
MRTGKELILASRPYAQEQRLVSWWHLGSTLLILAALITVACIASPWYLYVPAGILSGMVLVRLFIIYHDYMHGTIFRDSRVAGWILRGYGMVALSPPSIWKHSHDDHHKNNCKTFGTALGSFPILTTEDYANFSFWQRVGYIVARHPLIIGFGYITSFFVSMSLVPFLTNAREHYGAGLSILVHVSIAVCLAMISLQALVWGFLVPMIIAGALGSYLFYAQHNFPDIKRRHGDDWDYVFAALHSSSFMRMGRLMSWFTGNIGYHHVHHLNAKIPFYRLPEAMEGIKELQSPPTTSLHPVDVMRCLRLKLWDPASEKMLTFREATRVSRAA